MKSIFLQLSNGEKKEKKTHFALFHVAIKRLFFSACMFDRYIRSVEECTCVEKDKLQIVM